MKPIIVANWKATKNIAETIDWVTNVKNEATNLQNVELVVCPSFTSIPAFVQMAVGSNLKAGAQDVSTHPPGAFTGEVTAAMLKGLVSYCIVGHSERRRYYNEKEEQTAEKLEQLLEVGITPVLCISDLGQMDNYLQSSPDFKTHADKIIFVYEPPDAISGGGDFHPETPEEANLNASQISGKIGKKVVTLYGGSVSQESIEILLKQENINGVLVGKASLEPKTFIQLVRIASQTVV